MDKQIGAALAASLTLAVVGVGILSSRPAFADSLPAQAVPAGFRAMENPSGGRVLSGALPGVHSAQEAFHAGLHQLSRYFGNSLEITSAVRSPDDQMTTAFFRANLHGTPVTGVSLISFASGDSSREAILFDTATRFAKNLPSLTERLKTMPLPTVAPEPLRETPKGAQVALPPLHPQMAQDHTVGISIPSNWQVKYMQSGGVIVAGPGKQRVAMNSHITFLDPRSPRVQRAVQTAQFTHTRVVLPGPVAEYSTDISKAFTNAFEGVANSQGQPDPEVHIDTVKSGPPSKNGLPSITFLAGTKIESGVKMRFAGLASANSVGNGAWTLSWWMVFDTPEEFQQTVPLMMAIYQSCNYNGEADRKVKAQETAQFIASSKSAMASSKARHDTYMQGSQRRFASSMAAARASQDAIDRSAAGMIRVIQGSSVLEHTDTGAHGTIDANVAQAIAQQDPDHYRVVSQKDYRKGVDY